MVADLVVRTAQRLQLSAHPGNVLLDGAVEAAVVIDGAGVIAGADRIEVEPVDAAAVPQHNVLDLAPGQEFVDGHGPVDHDGATG